MWELVKAGGWLMWPIVLCSVLMLIIIIERAIKLKVSTVTPAHLREQLMQRLIEATESLNPNTLDRKVSLFLMFAVTFLTRPCR